MLSSFERATRRCRRARFSHETARGGYGTDAPEPVSKLGGQARMKGCSKEERQALGKKGGKRGGKARAKPGALCILDTVEVWRSSRHGPSTHSQKQYHRHRRTLHISEADRARDPYAILAQVEEGMDVVVERDHRPVATIRAPKRSGRPISECIASARANGSKVTLDGGFAKD